MKLEKIDTLFSPETSELKTGFSISKISVWSVSGAPTVEYWIFNPSGVKIGSFEGEDTEVMAMAAFRGIEQLKVQNQKQ